MKGNFISRSVNQNIASRTMAQQRINSGREDLLQAQRDLDARCLRLTFYIALAGGLDLSLTDVQTALDGHDDYTRVAANTYKARIDVLTGGTLATELPSSEYESILSVGLDNGKYNFISHQVSTPDIDSGT
jgi:hypothetical protein